ncbi:MAG: hypothetical protein DHS20C15_18740 [Planctomycetota bacterium]|nr:MAG: hypothetical protein DHS20C15_18740 [Planctomycetota bacterium]
MVLLLALSTGVANAQTLMGYGGGGVYEFTGPPAGPCGYPTGPIIGGFTVPMPFICATAGPVGAPAPLGILGGLANNSATDSTFVTDGFVITEYAFGGGVIRSFPPPAGLGPLTAIAYDPAGVLYCTDGALAQGMLPPAAPGCAPGVAATPPWGIGLGALSPPVTGLTWHPPTGTLYGIDAGGTVLTAPPGGPSVAVWAAVPDATCGMLGAFGPPQSIEFDRATPSPLSPSTFYLTDGAVLVRAHLGGAPGVPTGYTTGACTALPGPPVNGLAFTSHPVNYGTGSDPTGLLPPTFIHKGQFSTPSGPVSVGIAGADPTPGGMAAIFYNFGPVPFGGGRACPPIPGLGGNGVLLGIPFFGPFGPVLPIPGGAAAIGTAVPPGLPVGFEVNMQWFVAKGSGGFQLSDAMSITVSVP